MSSAPKTHGMSASSRAVEPMLKGKLYPKLFSFFRLRASFPKLVPGQYKTVSSTNFRVPGGTLCQVFYPAIPSKGATKRPYTRDAVLRGVAAFTGAPVTTMSPISRKKHHVYDSLQPVQDLPKKSIIFSHGLCGGSDIYTLLCRDLASFGYTVWALEHEDHSAAYAESEDGKPVYYVGPPSDLNVDVKDNVVNFREEFLVKRTHEIDLVYDLFGKPASELEKSVGSLVSALCENTDASQVVIAGHSFGGATAVMSAYQHPERYTKCLAYDTWTFPVPNKVLEAGLQIPTLSMLSGGFTQNNFTRDTQTLLRNTPEHYSYWIKGIEHQSFSDSPFYLGSSFLARKLALCGETDRKLVQEIITKTSNNFLNLQKPADDVREQEHKDTILSFL